MPDVSCHGGGVGDDDIDPGNSSKSSEREIMFEINVQVAAVAPSVSLHYITVDLTVSRPTP